MNYVTRDAFRVAKFDPAIVPIIEKDGKPIGGALTNNDTVMPVPVFDAFADIRAAVDRANTVCDVANINRRYVLYITGEPMRAAKIIDAVESVGGTVDDAIWAMESDGFGDRNTPADTAAIIYRIDRTNGKLTINYSAYARRDYSNGAWSRIVDIQNAAIDNRRINPNDTELPRNADTIPYYLAPDAEFIEYMGRVETTISPVVPINGQVANRIRGELEMYATAGGIAKGISC